MYTKTCTVPGLGGAKANEPPAIKDLAPPEHVSHKWTFHSYKQSHDGQATILHREEGFEVVFGGTSKKFEVDLMHYNPREFMWHPDSRQVLFWGALDEDGKPPHGSVRHRHEYIQLMDVRSMVGDEPWKLAYDPAKTHKVEGPTTDKEVMDPHPFGFEWSPAGEAFFVIERLYYKNDPGRAYETAIQRIELSSLTNAKEIVRTQGQIDFFMPPVSRFEDGTGPSRKPYRLAFGHSEGLFVVDPKPGTTPRKLSSLPAIDLHNIEWNPDENAPEQLLLFFKRAAPGSDGKVFAGVILVHLDRIGHEGKGPWCEQLYDKTDVHTLWFSAKGTYATWAAKEFVGYRKPLDPKDKTVVVVCKSKEGELLEVKGTMWHPNERHLAITAGARLFVHDAQQGTTTEIAHFGDNDSMNFTAEPRWVGNTILFTQVEDVMAQVLEAQRVPIFKVRPKQ